MLKDGEASGEEGGEGITDECAMLLTSERHSHVSTLQRVLKSHTSKCGTTCQCLSIKYYYKLIILYPACSFVLL